jgi:hypothetical protein
MYKQQFHAFCNKCKRKVLAEAVFSHGVPIGVSCEKGCTLSMELAFFCLVPPPTVKKTFVSADDQRTFTSSPL